MLIHTKPIYRHCGWTPNLSVSQSMLELTKGKCLYMVCMVESLLQFGLFAAMNCRSYHHIRKVCVPVEHHPEGLELRQWEEEIL